MDQVNISKNNPPIICQVKIGTKQTWTKPDKGGNRSAHTLHFPSQIDVGFWKKVSNEQHSEMFEKIKEAVIKITNTTELSKESKKYNSGNITVWTTANGDCQNKGNRIEIVRLYLGKNENLLIFLNNYTNSVVRKSQAAQRILEALELWPMNGISWNHSCRFHM